MAFSFVWVIGPFKAQKSNVIKLLETVNILLLITNSIDKKITKLS
jgi:hypothetical protein